MVFYLIQLSPNSLPRLLPLTTVIHFSNMLNLFQAQRFYMCSHFYLKYSLAIASSFGFQFKCHLLLQLSYPYSILVIPFLLTVFCFYGIFYYLIKYHLFLCSLIYCLSLFQDYKLSMVSLYWFVSRQIRALYVIAEHVNEDQYPRGTSSLPTTHAQWSV